METDASRSIRLGDNVVIPGQDFYLPVVKLHPTYVELLLPQRNAAEIPVFICKLKLMYNPRRSLWEPIHEEVILHTSLPVRTSSV